ncbi:zinc ribbon domain-containing protein [Shewanella livingstonensis]|uniref:Zinc ribbon domain-containing protein n=1 Tax=Shewanella livingstonensis TaxID=150120 RepID=A0A3G8LZF1_9GAMM|nr:zinc ribbon domain-containing protein [Shewanella livingstonensis]AZG74130.1 zinc ribbon domain-containing protein [Shewanella livingstonensis]
MKHCTTTLTIEDHYCPDCGDKIDNLVTIKSITVLHPDIIDELKVHCPNATIYTGWVEKTHYYKRRFQSGGSNSETLYYSYWFLTFNNENGEQKTVSISAEDSSLARVVKGDVITILMPTDYSANYPLAYKSEANLVTHNELAPVVVFHRDSGQESIREPGYRVEDFSKFGIFISALFLCCILGVIGGYFALYPFELGATLTVIATIISSSMWISRRTKTFDAETARLDEIKNTTKRILSVSIDDMGYNQRARQAKKDDVYCHHCDALNDNQYRYCSSCGALQINEMASELIVDANKAHNERDTHSLTELGNNTIERVVPPSRLTRQEKIQQTCHPFITHNESDYLHKHVLVSHFPCTITSYSQLVKVIDKSVQSDVSDNTQVSSRTTRTDYKNHYGMTIRSEYNTTTTSHRQRDSSIYGELMVETPEGEEKAFKAPQSLLGTADIGDWILLGYSRVEGRDTNDDYNEFYFNINKNETIKPETATHWSRTSNKSQMIILMLLILAIAVTVYFQPVMNAIFSIIPYAVGYPVFKLTDMLHIPINYSPLVLFTLVFILLIIIKSKFNRSNQKRRTLALGSLYDTLQQCQRAREPFLKL